MTRVVAYVDGFNLYLGLKAGYGRRYHSRLSLLAPADEAWSGRTRAEQAFD